MSCSQKRREVMASAHRRKKRQTSQKRLCFISAVRVVALRARLARSGADCMTGETVLAIQFIGSSVWVREEA